MHSSDRERRAWTEFVREREQRQDGKRASKHAKKRQTKKPEVSPAKLEAALDGLTGKVPPSN
jgi:hypothetical protein